MWGPTMPRHVRNINSKYGIMHIFVAQIEVDFFGLLLLSHCDCEVIMIWIAKYSTG